MPEEKISDVTGLNLPDFERPMDETPSPMTYQQAAQSMEEMIQTFRLLESEPPAREEILPFVM